MTAGGLIENQYRRQSFPVSYFISKILTKNIEINIQRGYTVSLIILIMERKGHSNE